MSSQSSPNQSGQRIIIHNPVWYHYECIESVIHYLPRILGARYQPSSPELVLNIVPEPGFIKYINTYKHKLMKRYGFSNIIINEITTTTGEYNTTKPYFEQTGENDLQIVLTIPGDELADLSIFTRENTYYILHNYIPWPITGVHPDNVFYLPPHCKTETLNYFIPDILPFSSKSVSADCQTLVHTDSTGDDANSESIVILVQGSIHRRDPRLLIELARSVITNTRPDKLIILTRSTNIRLPRHPRIRIIHKADFWDFHQAAAQCNIIATLVSLASHPKYYKSKLTSSISYGLGYNMRFLIDSKLAGIYGLDSPSNIIYDNKKDFLGKIGFKK